MGGGCTPCLFRPSQTQFLTPQTSVRDACISEKNPKQNPKGKKGKRISCIICERMQMFAYVY